MATNQLASNGVGVSQKSADRERARELVLQWGWNATCYQILNPGFRLWFAPEGDAVVGYVECNRTRLVGGAPVCAKDRLRDVAQAFEFDARRNGHATCYFAAEARLEALYRNSPTHSMITLGSQPTLEPSGWAWRIQKHASLRAQLHRARNKGVVVEEWPPEVARQHPELRRCLSEWLEGRGLPPLHFLIETDTLSSTKDRTILVATQKEKVIGFLVASPVPQRQGWLIEQIVRGQDAVNGTSELLVDEAIRRAAAVGSEYVSFGLAPLSANTERSNHENPVWLRLILTWIRAHGRRFYNFRGLESYKAKFEPDVWDPVYAIVNARHFGPSTLYAVASAFAQGSPIVMIAGTILHGVRQELHDFGRTSSGGDTVGRH